MKGNYGSDYSSIGFLVGRGLIRTVYEDSIQNTALQLPPPYSVENLLIDHSEAYLYLPAGPGLVQIRHVGAVYLRGQFNAINPRSRLDGFIFIRDSQPVEDPPVKRDMKELHAHAMNKLLKNFERNKALSPPPEG